MDQEAKYFRDKWLEALKQLEFLRTMVEHYQGLTKERDQRKQQRRKK